MTQDTPLIETSNQRANLWIGYALCVVAAFVIWLLIGQYIANPATDPFEAGLDVDFYRRESLQILEGGPFAFESAVHAYGYPLFVTFCTIVANALNQPVMGVVTIVQFGLHLATAVLSVMIFRRLYNTNHPSIGKQLGVFFLIVCNPILLAATYYMLSDGITVFWLTLALAAALSTWQRRWWIVGVTLGICIVTRPYHQVWAIVLLVGLLVTVSFLGWVQRYRLYVNSRQVRRGFLQLIIPIIIIVGLQYVIVYQKYGVWSMVGPTGSKAIQIHITGSLYYYRYETLLRPDGSATGVRYLNTSIQRNIAPVAIHDPSMVALYIEQLRTDPLSLPYMVLLKAVSLFQNYDFRIFLLQEGVTSPLALSVGLGLFILFVQSVQTGVLYVIRLARQRLTTSKRTASSRLKLTPSMVLCWVIVTYVGLYTAATVPEPRFIFPIFPVVTVLGIYVMSQPRPLWERVSAPLIASVLYGITILIVIPTAILG